ncbi:MAG: hypothetical protein ACXWQO_02435 [Bdellovibrionota bacterium]
MSLFKLMTALLAMLAALPALAEKDCAECSSKAQRSPAVEISSLPMRAVASLAEEYDFSDIVKFPLFERPGTKATFAMSDDSPLVKKMNTDRASFSRLRYLLPNKFRIADGKQFQPVIDDAILKMASTEAGKQAVCVFSVDGIKDVEMYLGVSTAAAKKVRDACVGRNYSEAAVGRLRVMREVRLPFFPIPLVPAKKFVFLFSESGRPEIEGYSTKNNTTYLVLSPESQNAASISRLVAHEIATSYDQLSRLGYLANPSSIEDMGVNLAFGLPNGEYVFENPSRADLEKMKCAFRDPAIRYAASAQRAFNFEDAVRSELGDKTRAAATGSCSEILAKNSLLLQAMARTVSWDTGWYDSQCGIAKTPAARMKEILSRVKTVAATRLPCKNTEACGDKKEMSLCELLLHPRIGPFSADLDSGGPRPSMGGGWSEKISSDQDLMIRAIKGESVSKEEAARLGQRLTFPNADELFHEEQRQEGLQP